MLEKLVKKHYSRIYAYCNSILLNAEKAKDVCQEVFLQMVRSRDILDREKNIPGWLVTVARRKCYDLWRNEAAQKTSALTDEEPPDRSPGPEELLVTKETKKEMLNALAELKSLDRELIVLKDLNCMNYKEIADSLELTVDQVKWMLFKARAKLKKAVE